MLLAINFLIINKSFEQNYLINLKINTSSKCYLTILKNSVIVPVWRKLFSIKTILYFLQQFFPLNIFQDCEFWLCMLLENYFLEVLKLKCCKKSVLKGLENMYSNHELVKYFCKIHFLKLQRGVESDLLLQDVSKEKTWKNAWIFFFWFCERKKNIFFWIINTFVYKAIWKCRDCKKYLLIFLD